MTANRRLGDEEPFRNRARREALPQTVEHLPFPRREVSVGGPDETRFPRAVTELLDQTGGEPPG